MELIRRNRPDADLDDQAAIDGVAFSEADLGEEEAGLATEGRADAAEFLIGVDFPCNALLIVRLEHNDVGPRPFLIDFSFIPSESDR